MKTITRTALGLSSSLLLAAGFSRAAQKLDPLSNSIAGTVCNMKDKPAAPCGFPCLFVTE